MKVGMVFAQRFNARWDGVVVYPSRRASTSPPPLPRFVVQVLYPVAALLLSVFLLIAALAGFAVWSLALDARSKGRGRWLTPWRP